MSTRRRVRNTPPVRPKLGRADEPRDERLSLAEHYLAFQAQSPDGPAVAAEAAVLKAALDDVKAKVQGKVNLLALLTIAQVDLLRALGTLAFALFDYAHAAAKVAGIDGSVLAGLGVTARARPGGPAKGAAVGAPENLEVVAGAAPGEATATCDRVPGAGAYIFQYLPEPPPPGATWLSPDDASTKYTTYKVVGLEAEQRVRVRVRAIGDAQGPWSVEVIGRCG